MLTYQLTGSVLLPLLRRQLHPLRVLRLTLPIGAALGVVVVTASDWRVALVALAAWGSAYLIVLINTMTYSQEVTPDHLQGRVNTTRRMLSSGLGIPLGALASGTLTVHVDIRAGMSTAIVAMTTAALLAWTVGRFRETESQPVRPIMT